MSRKPMLQLALDTLTIEEAISNVQKVRDYIDIIEVGTILISSVGKSAISILKATFPEKIIIADGKVADAGSIFGKMFFGQGANYVTAICAAEPQTMSELLKVGQEIDVKNEVQVELTSNFTWEQAQQWRDHHITQAVWHRARDAQAAGVKWGQKDLDSIRKLVDLGFLVTVTGGVELEDIKYFKDLPIYIFIAGRSIRDAKDPAAAAKAFKDEFNKYW
ncbi:3-keto-L-gulonate-6-phosphate decarboxylase UlaD [Mycoplasma iguanae]|uniref:3-keto-L-gulonate-6-phosphate decarboxylase UlaD n=1 Tax=Mycoplasma iguanae TaxID=292461 RepID=A0ABY5R8W6_9MOLU|nr:3-keto-L-gulonate-6-phosphate decarboxylase UlaD [Mycoplasma iguanae]UVD81883.1 3-keto-L-gulonate-6-phosphate decarboxylase UlaD [Mycoplasma iguanae]